MSEPDEDSSDRGWEHRDPQDVLERMRPGEPYTTGELAEELGWPRRSALHVLDDLADEGAVRKKKPEARRVIWMLTDAETGDHES